jgi:hypothetical protein
MHRIQYVNMDMKAQLGENHDEATTAPYLISPLQVIG